MINLTEHYFAKSINFATSITSKKLKEHLNEKAWHTNLFEQTTNFWRCGNFTINLTIRRHHKIPLFTQKEEQTGLNKHIRISTLRMLTEHIHARTLDGKIGNPDILPVLLRQMR